jgi:hypothetical protein
VYRNCECCHPPCTEKFNVMGFLTVIICVTYIAFKMRGERHGKRAGGVILLGFTQLL